MKKRFLVVYEHGKRNYGGFAPDVPGCISTGRTLADVRKMMKEALESHFEFMASDGDPLPTPLTSSFPIPPEADSNGEVDHYVVEFLEVEMPVASKMPHTKTA